MTRPDHEGDEAGRCGGCGSRSLTFTRDRKHAVCADCRRLQEPEVRDWPESEMCDNCAFRKGSPERADPDRWAKVMATVHTGQTFHCHKGLAMKVNEDGEGVLFEKPSPETGRVTACAGWLRAYGAECWKRERQG